MPLRSSAPVEKVGISNPPSTATHRSLRLAHSAAQHYVGERHVVVEDLTQVAPGVEWCNFVEHPDLRQVVTKGRWDTVKQ